MRRLHRILELLLAHGGEEDMCAEHDQIYLGGPAPEDLPAEVVAELEELGAHWDAGLPSWYVYT